MNNTLHSIVPFRGSVYLHRGYCQSDRIVLHPKGLPPGRRDCGLTESEERAAIEAAVRIVNERREITDPHVLAILQRRSPRCTRFDVTFAYVIHLNPFTLEFIEALPVT